jgi:hypothetical protein
MVWWGGPYRGFGWIDDSTLEHNTVLASFGVKAEVGRGGAGLAMDMGQDLVE